jgi:beta-lactam-binding protein with PASTA domain/predicted Ser/Thr protein kinase
VVGAVLSDRYEIIEKLGGGGMAVVYKAKDTLLGRLVAIKVLRDQFAQDETFVERFGREAQAGARLSHPNIVSIFDVGRHGDDHYLVMEYVEGTNLKNIINEKGRLNENQVIRIGIELCEALEHAHENGLIHCDIKPHNILINDRGRVKVTDFGIARACTSDTITFAGSLVGSVHYFSPEQARGGTADIQSDIYSASVVLYELATGKQPFTAESPVSVALKQITEEPVPPSEINPEISPELESIILRGMSKSPQDRFTSAAEMKEALSELNGGEPAFPVNGQKEKVKTKKLRPAGWVALAAALLLVAVIGYFAALGFFKVDEVEVPNVVNEELEKATEMLEEAGLKVNVLSEIHDIEVPEGHVISQNPEGGERVKKNRVVTLEVSLGPEIVEVPDVTNQTLRDAEITLSEAGFKVAPDVSYIYDSKVGEGKVIQQIPKAREKEEQGQEIRLVVSKGPQPEYIEMPDLRGMSMADAQKKLDEVRLKLGNVSNAESKFYFSGQVADQSVKPGSSILQGKSVDIVVSKGPGPEPQLASVTVSVPNDGEKHRIRIEVVDSKGSHEEYNNLHNPGDIVREKVAFFGEGTIRIYRDGQIVHEQPVP